MAKRIKMKIGFITTIETNIGDDFIREGIINLLKASFSDERLDFVMVNKHLPYTAYPSWHPLHYFTEIGRIRGGGKLQKLTKKIFRGFGSKYENCDVIIQSGAPVLWPGCKNCEWNVPIWQEIIGRLYKRIKVFNIAAGSGYPWERQADHFTDSEDEKFAAMIGKFCSLITTRDKLSNKLFNSIGVKNRLMPCTAFFVDKTFENSSDGEYVLVNYMEGGGHYDWDQRIDKDSWRNAMLETITFLRKDHEVRFICHDEKESDLARELVPGAVIYRPGTVAEYIQIVKHAKIGINNRMHASVAMASVGVPAISVCTDTRLLMLETLGLPIFYVKEAKSQDLISTAQHLLNNFKTVRQDLFSLKEEKFKEYVSILRENVNQGKR